MSSVGMHRRGTMVMSLLAGTGVAMLATPARAQLAAPSGVHAPLGRSAVSPLVAGAVREKSGLPGRLGLALVGGAAGGLGGALLGYIIPGGGGEDPGLDAMVATAAIGAAFGAALFAALPESSAPCDYSDRFGRGLLGAALGATIGLLGSGDSRVVTMPLGGVVGAALGAESCEWWR